MKFGLLGPLSVDDDEGVDRTPGSPKGRALLTALLLAAGRPVSPSRLEAALWGEHPPATARASLHNHVLRLRRSLGDGTRVRAVPAGLVLDVGDGELDTRVFAAHVEAARTARLGGDWERVAREAGAALALWRGAPLEEFPALASEADAQLGQWQEARLQALEWRCDAELSRGRHDALLPELSSLTVEFPLREAFRVQLMRVLHRSGHRAEALAVYHRLRRALIEELGIEPGPEASAAYQEILTDEVPPPAEAPEAATVPTSLPRDVASFTGREEEVRRLIEEVRATAAGGAGVVGIHAVDGMPGVGKTAFAVHVAHRLAADFPDGVLFLPLHAHTPGTPPVDVATALTGLLLALGADPRRIPAEVHARAGMWRGRLAGGRFLVLLDDAHSSEQVEPLLPGTAGSLVLITSRRRLVALADAVPLTLDVLPEDRAVQLLVAKAGRADLRVGQPAVAALARLCGHLPLALQLTAARLRHHRAWSAEDLISDLDAASGRLAALSSENVSVRAAFELSYRDLSPQQRALFRRLGRQPGLDFDAYAVAALHGTDLTTARRLLADLEDHHLVEEPTRGRYRMHDLVRAYARALAESEDGADAANAVARQLDYYLHAAVRAGRLFARYGATGRTPSVPAPPALPPLADEAAALAWLRAERDNLFAAVAHAARHGHTAHAVQLPPAIGEFLRTQGYWSDAVALYRTAHGAALLADDRLGQAVALRETGVIEAIQGEYESAERHQRAALELFEALGERGHEAIAREVLASVMRRTGRYEEAQSALARALRLFDETGDARGQAQVLNELGHVQQLTGRFLEAADAMTRALGLHRALANRLGEANALTALGDVRKSMGQYADSVVRHREALVLYRELGSELGEANALGDLADVLRLTGAYEEARESATEALRLYRALGARLGEANALTHLARIRQCAGHLTEAGKDLQEALDICRSLSSRLGEACVLRYLAEVQGLTGETGYALENAAASVRLCREIGDQGGEAEALNILGTLQRVGAAPADAFDAHGRALELAREVRAPYEEARALEGLGESLHALGRTGEAVDRLTRALAVARELRVPDADRIQARLAAVTVPGA
ncbi:BTAD domain-containing putative transcriptional regulator [Streptomyces sp. NPDC059070]|uniref:AfsR/SARP family transcriptional regulator n=1 Tax=Streptomyces sp. NPDC059070 TaxID=3346713 RepID=UPI0036CB2274